MECLMFWNFHFRFDASRHSPPNRRCVGEALTGAGGRAIWAQKTEKRNIQLIWNFAEWTQENANIEYTSLWSIEWFCEIGRLKPKTESELETINASLSNFKCHWISFRLLQMCYCANFQMRNRTERFVCAIQDRPNRWTGHVPWLWCGRSDGDRSSNILGINQCWVAAHAGEFNIRLRVSPGPRRTQTRT